VGGPDRTRTWVLQPSWAATPAGTDVMLSRWQMIRAKIAVAFGRMIGVPVSVDTEYFLPELEKRPICRGWRQSNRLLGAEDFDDPNQSQAAA